MSTPRDFSHITVASTPFKKRLDKEAKKCSVDVEKDVNIALKCADRFNYNTNFHRRLTLSDRFELNALGFEMKEKSNGTVSKEPEQQDFIYRKEKRQDTFGSPQSASPQNPLPAGRGFLTPPAHSATVGAFVYSGAARRGAHRSPKPVIRPPTRSVFDDTPDIV